MIDKVKSIKNLAMSCFPANSMHVSEIIMDDVYTDSANIPHEHMMEYIQNKISFMIADELSELIPVTVDKLYGKTKFSKKVVVMSEENFEVYLENVAELIYRKMISDGN
jgi:hypothetical protein